MRKILYAIILILLLAILYVQFSGPKADVAQDTDLPTQADDNAALTGTDDGAMMADDADDAMADEGEAMMESMFDEDDDVVEFTMGGENFKFTMDGEDNPDLVVNEGDNVRIVFVSTSGFHDWVVDEFDAATAQVRPEDGVTIVEFVADEAGEYEYYCSVGQHRANGMWGNFIVE